MKIFLMSTLILNFKLSSEFLSVVKSPSMNMNMCADENMNIILMTVLIFIKFLTRFKKYPNMVKEHSS